MSRRGLGTPATRASILEKLVQMGFVQRKGKQLLPTKDGINLAAVLPEALTSPALTAEWETRLSEIAKGEADPDEFMAGIEAQARDLVTAYSCVSEDKGTGVEPIEFYKWTAFSYTPWIILPVVLGMLCTMLMYNENQYDILKQLWIVPVNKVAYFFSKFVVVLTYSICFMLIIAATSILTGVLPGYIAFDSASTLYLLRKCMEISLLTAFAVLPVLAVAAVQKGYILPVCLTLVYTFLGFILLMVNMYLHPLSSMTAIVMRDIPGVVITQPLNIPGAFLCIGVWSVASVMLAGAVLKKRK